MLFTLQRYKFLSKLKPPKEELNETRRYLDASKREMARQRKAIDSANS